MPPALRTQPHDAELVEPAAGSLAPVRLTALHAGDRGRLHDTRLLVEDLEMLRALGLAERCRFRVCKAGNPWILQVRGTRVGISDTVARRILVMPER